MGSAEPVRGDYSEWCVRNGVTHAHCPDGCEKPQPVWLGGEMVCGRCWSRFGERVPVVPCTPEVCNE